MCNYKIANIEPVIKLFLLSCLCTYICLLYLLSMGCDDTVYITLFTINTYLVMWNIFNIHNQPFSLHILVNIFILTFFILANGVQFTLSSNVLTFGLSFLDWDFIHFQVVNFFIIIFYNYFYSLRIKVQTKLSNLLIHHTNSIIISKRKLLLLSLLSTLIILIHFHFDLYRLFFRGFTEEMMQDKGITTLDKESTSASLIFSQFIRPIPWACFLLSLLYFKHKNIKIQLFFMALITVFPLGLPRNATAMYWLPILLALLRKQITGYRFITIMFIGIFVVFPFLENFRRFDGNISLSLSLDFLNSMHFDASEIMMATMKSEIVTYGKQLLGVFLFWLPRSIWPGKPEGSGHFLVHEYEDSFSNVSMPFFSEGYINFGYLGILLFVFICAYLSKLVDTIFWSNHNIRNFVKAFYYIAISALLFIMRGDLMSSFAYTLATFVCYSFVLLFCKRSAA